MAISKDMTWELTKIGLVSTAISIPIGLWSLKKHSHLTTAVLLTAVSFAVKHFMLGGEHKALPGG